MTSPESVWFKDPVISANPVVMVSSKDFHVQATGDHLPHPQLPTPTVADHTHTWIVQTSGCMNEHSHRYQSDKDSLTLLKAYLGC